MPAYPGNNQATLLYENKQKFMFQNELFGVGNINQASVAFQLRRTRGASYPFGASFELHFSGVPGVFAVSIQMSDTDMDDHYVTVNTINAVNANNTALVQLPAMWAKFVRGIITTLTNPVTTTLMVTR